MFLESIYSIKVRQSEERVNVATKQVQYTCTCLIDYLTYARFFQAKMFIFGIIVELLDYLFSFYSYQFIINLLNQNCYLKSLCSLCTFDLIRQKRFHSPYPSQYSLTTLFSISHSKSQIQIFCHIIVFQISTQILISSFLNIEIIIKNHHYNNSAYITTKLLWKKLFVSTSCLIS